MALLITLLYVWEFVLQMQKIWQSNFWKSYLKPIPSFLTKKEQLSIQAAGIIFFMKFITQDILFKWMKQKNINYLFSILDTITVRFPHGNVTAQARVWVCLPHKIPTGEITFKIFYLCWILIKYFILRKGWPHKISLNVPELIQAGDNIFIQQMCPALLLPVSGKWLWVSTRTQISTFPPKKSYSQFKMPLDRYTSS